MEVLGSPAVMILSECLGEACGTFARGNAVLPIAIETKQRVEMVTSAFEWCVIPIG